MSGGFFKDPFQSIEGTLNSLGHDISNGWNSLNHAVGGNLGLITGAALIAAGIYDPELLGLANTGELTASSLTGSAVTDSQLSTLGATATQTSAANVAAVQAAAASGAVSVPTAVAAGATTTGIASTAAATGALNASLVGNLLSAGASVGSLLGVGTPVTALLTAGASYESMVAGGLTAANMLGMGASVAELLGARAPIIDLLSGGASVDSLVAGGLTTTQIIGASLGAGASAANLLGAPKNVQQLLALGASASSLYNAGVNINTIMSQTPSSQVPATVRDLSTNSNVSTGELVQAGATPEQVVQALGANQVGALLTEANPTQVVNELLNSGTSVQTLLDQGATPQQLLNAGQTPQDLMSAGVSTQNLLNAGVAPQTLMQSGVSAGDLYQAGVGINDLTQLGATTQELYKAGATPQELITQAGATPQELVQAGATPQELLNAGTTPQQLLSSGVSASELARSGVSGEQLFNAGASLNDINNAGISTNQLLINGVSTDSLLNAGANVNDLIDAGAKPTDLINAGVDPQQLLNSGVNAEQLLQAGTSPGQLLSDGVDTKTLLNDGVNAATLYQAGASTQSLINAGAAPEQLLGAGATPEQLISAGIDPNTVAKEMATSNFNANQIGSELTASGATPLNSSPVNGAAYMMPNGTFLDAYGNQLASTNAQGQIVDTNGTVLSQTPFTPNAGPQTVISTSTPTTTTAPTAPVAPTEPTTIATAAPTAPTAPVAPVVPETDPATTVTNTQVTPYGTYTTYADGTTYLQNQYGITNLETLQKVNALPAPATSEAPVAPTAAPETTVATAPAPTTPTAAPAAPTAAPETTVATAPTPTQTTAEPTSATPSVSSLIPINSLSDWYTKLGATTFDRATNTAYNSQGQVVSVGTPVNMPPPATPLTPVILPDGTVGAYDATTGTVYNSNGSVNQTATNMGQSITNTASNNPSSTVAGPMRVDMSGIAYDTNTPPPPGTQLPSGTQLAKNGEEGAYFDTGTSSWVMPIPNQGAITQPIVPVETTPTAPVTTVEVGGPPISNTGAPGTEPTNGAPSNVVAGTTTPVAPNYTPLPLNGGTQVTDNGDGTVTAVNNNPDGTTTSTVLNSSTGTVISSTITNPATNTTTTTTNDPVTNTTSTSTTNNTTGATTTTPLTPVQPIDEGATSTVAHVEATTPETGGMPTQVSSPLVPPVEIPPVIPATTNTGGSTTAYQSLPIPTYTGAGLVNPGVNPGFIEPYAQYGAQPAGIDSYYWGPQNYVQTAKNLGQPNAQAPATPYGQASQLGQLITPSQLGYPNPQLLAAAQGTPNPELGGYAGLANMNYDIYNNPVQMNTVAPVVPGFGSTYAAPTQAQSQMGAGYAQQFGAGLNYAFTPPGLTATPYSPYTGTNSAAPIVHPQAIATVTNPYAQAASAALADTSMSYLGDTSAATPVVPTTHT